MGSRRDGTRRDGGPGHGRRGGRRGPRCRRLVEPGVWEGRARVERFVEPALLLLLREGSSHGYDLADRLADLVADEQVDLGNLYRLLRALEDEGVVASEWRGDLPGRAKRRYVLTESGEALLDSWAEALDRTETTIADFGRRYQIDAKR